MLALVLSTGSKSRDSFKACEHVVDLERGYQGHKREISTGSVTGRTGEPTESSESLAGGAG